MRYENNEILLKNIGKKLEKKTSNLKVILTIALGLVIMASFSTIFFYYGRTNPPYLYHPYIVATALFFWLFIFIIHIALRHREILVETIQRKDKNNFQIKEIKSNYFMVIYSNPAVNLNFFVKIKL